MKRITLFKNTIVALLLVMISCMAAGKVSAQLYCENELVIWSEDFGTGSATASNANVINLNYDSGGPLSDDGTYRLRDWSDQNIGWHKHEDHTPNDVSGRMVLVNGKSESFYRRAITRQVGYPAGFYAVSFWVLNVSITGTCSPNPVIPKISVKAEYRDENNNWIELINSPVTTAPVPETASPVWVRRGAVFTLPTTGNFLITRMRFTLSDDVITIGCGNDFAIDDIKLATCPSGGPLPVSFLGVTARQKGSGVAIDWSTASEFNNKYFDIEKSTNGGNSWSLVSSTLSKGNGTSNKNYSGYDARPVQGVNLYRIRQVDTDGNSKYSNTVSFKLNIVKTDVSVLMNPFNTNITVDFLTTHSQVVNARLFETSGKQLLSQQFTVVKGTYRKVIEGVAGLNRGVYILQIVDENNEVIYHDKLIKQ